MSEHGQLIGLCDEIAALVRLNLPLEESLRNRGNDLPKQLGDRIRAIADHLEAGESLTEAIEKEQSFPPAYLAIIESGIESGNLSGTLELLARNLRILRDSRNFIVGATMYPMFVFTILWALLSVVLFQIGPVFADFYASFSFHLPLVEHLDLLREYSLEYMIGMLTVLVLLWTVYGIWCYRTNRSVLLTFRPPPFFFWLRSANRDLARATFAQVVSLLIRCEMPLPRALTLAFRAVGERDWAMESEENIQRYLTEDKENTALRHRKSPISPLVRWLLSVPDREILLTGLDQYAEMGVFRAKSHLNRLELWLPVAAMLLLGGTVFVAYFLTIIFPYGYLLYHLSVLTP